MTFAGSLVTATRLGFLMGLFMSDAVAQYYLGGQAGWTGLPYQTDTLEGDAAIPVSFNAGYNVGVRGGYRFGSWRFEEEYSYRHNNVAEYGEASAAVNGNRHSHSIMTNVVYDFILGWPVSPHVGVGIGAMNVSDHLSIQGSGILFNDSSWQFGYQAIAGLRYEINPCLALDLDYRYLATTESMFRIPNTRLYYRTGDNTNNFSASLTYLFPALTPIDPFANPAAAPP